MAETPNRRLARRDVLKGAAAIGVAVPVLWHEIGGSAASSTPTVAIGPHWIAFGPDPTTDMYVTWSAGSANGARQSPPAPQIRWGPTASYGSTLAAARSGAVPMPSPNSGEPAENTIYSSVLLTGLAAGATYHYSVSNDGATWSADAAFTTAVAGDSQFQFTAFGDQAALTASSGPMASLVGSLRPAFHLMAGDLSYATPKGLKYPDVTGFEPSQWDNYLGLVGPRAAQSIPWQASVGAHEVEPLDSFGYAGFITRFAQPYDTSSGTPVVHTFRYGNVAILHLDGNDLSAQGTINTGYSQGGQTAWLGRQLEAYRAAGTGIDFIVVVVNCCCYSTNQTHGSDGGLRDAWGHLFDSYQVDLVVSGHVHAYERTHPIRAHRPTRTVASGGSVDPVTDGTTYICAGGGGNTLYKTWYGATDAGDTGSSTPPKIWRFSDGDTASGGNGTAQRTADTVTGYSAFRRAVWSCLLVNVTPPTATDRRTTMSIQALMPAQSNSAVTDISAPTIIDSVSLTRTRAS